MVDGLSVFCFRGVSCDKGRPVGGWSRTSGSLVAKVVFRSGRAVWWVDLARELRWMPRSGWHDSHVRHLLVAKVILGRLFSGRERPSVSGLFAGVSCYERPTVAGWPVRHFGSRQDGVSVFCFRGVSCDKGRPVDGWSRTSGSLVAKVAFRSGRCVSVLFSGGQLR